MLFDICTLNCDPRKFIVFSKGHVFATFVLLCVNLGFVSGQKATYVLSVKNDSKLNMEDAVESLIVEEESRKLIKSKSIFHRFRNKSITENNNPADRKLSTPKNDSMNLNEDSVDSKILTPHSNGVKESILNGIKEKDGSPPQKNSSCLLLRLFESKLFEMSIAMSYLFKSKESGVQAYLGNKLFVSVYYCGNFREIS